MQPRLTRYLQREPDGERRSDVSRDSHPRLSYTRVSGVQEVNTAAFQIWWFLSTCIDQVFKAFLKLAIQTLDFTSPPTGMKWNQSHQDVFVFARGAEICGSPDLFGRAAGRGVGDGPGRLFSGSELCFLEDFDEYGEDVGVDHRLGTQINKIYVNNRARGLHYTGTNRFQTGYVV